MQKILNLIGQYRSRENEARFRCYAATRKLTNTPAVFLSLSGSWFILIKHTESATKKFSKKGVLRSFAKFTGEYLLQKLISDKVARLELF